MSKDITNKKHKCPLEQELPPKEMIILWLRTPQEAIRDYKEWERTGGLNEQDDGNKELRR